MDAGVFKDLINLEKLYLRFHKLTSLGPGVFSGLCNLKELTLSRNKLTSLDDDVFKDLLKLEELDLESNKFVSIKSQVFRPLVNLKVLWFDEHLLKSEDLRNCVGKFCGNWRKIVLFVLQNKIYLNHEIDCPLDSKLGNKFP